MLADYGFSSTERERVRDTGYRKKPHVSYPKNPCFIDTVQKDEHKPMVQWPDNEMYWNNIR
jgi:hypothetical protein